MVGSERLESRHGGNEGTEFEDLSLVASPGDKTSHVALDKLPNLMEFQLTHGQIEKIVS